MFGKYSILLWGCEFPYIIARNRLFAGLTYFSVGLLLREKKCETDKIPAWVLGILTLIFP